MRDDRETLEAECAVLTRYLLGMEPTQYVAGKYVAAHETLDVLTASRPFDRLLVRTARRSVLLRRPAAALARVGSREGTLRNKLVVLLAILETAPPSADLLDRAPVAGRARLTALLVVRGMIAAVSLIAGAAFLGPIRWVRAKGA